MFRMRIETGDGGYIEGLGHNFRQAWDALQWPVPPQRYAKVDVYDDAGGWEYRVWHTDVETIRRAVRGE